MSEYLREILYMDDHNAGFYDSAGRYGKRRATDPVTGNYPCRLRGVDYEYGFEIVLLNKEPALEKVLDNIRMINKSLPFEIVTTSERNDAAVKHLGSVPGDRVLRQK
jgi:hypothetical protein